MFRLPILTSLYLLYRASAKPAAAAAAAASSDDEPADLDDDKANDDPFSEISQADSEQWVYLLHL